MGKKTQQNFFTIDSTKCNIKMTISITKNNGAPIERYSAKNKPTNIPYLSRSHKCTLTKTKLR